MYAQPTSGPVIPPVIAHIYFAKLPQRTFVTPPPTCGILAELSELRRH